MLCNMNPGGVGIPAPIWVVEVPCRNLGPNGIHQSPPQKWYLTYSPCEQSAAALCVHIRPVSPREPKLKDHYK
jgi:hypothetical protein